MATIVKSITANAVKNGAATIRLAPGSQRGMDNFTDITGNAAIVDNTFDGNMVDARFDHPRYYHGDTVN